MKPMTIADINEALNDKLRRHQSWRTAIEAYFNLPAGSLIQTQSATYRYEPRTELHSQNKEPE